MHEKMTEQRLKKFIMQRFPLARRYELGVSDPLLENGVVDSLGVLDLVSFMEQEFSISITDEELIPENFHTIARLIAFVHGKRGEADAA